MMPTDRQSKYWKASLRSALRLRITPKLQMMPDPTPSTEANTGRRRWGTVVEDTACAARMNDRYFGVATDEGVFRPPARSFRPRRRALSPTREVAYQRQLEQWRLPADGPLLEWAQVFAAMPAGEPGVSGDTAPVLDIGFGGGEGLVALAAAEPHRPIVGVEVHTPGIAHVLAEVEAHSWPHVRVVDTDVLEFLPRVPLASLAGVRLWFPDPWPKTKQRHRRLFRPDVVAALVDRVRPGGTLHIATDIADYARQVQDVAAGETRLHGGVVPRPSWRPETRYERRGLAAGRSPVDLIYTVVEPPERTARVRR